MGISLIAIAALIAGGTIAIAGGPVGWALLIMIGVPIAFLVLVGSSAHEGKHANFATPPIKVVPPPPR